MPSSQKLAKYAHMSAKPPMKSTASTGGGISTSASSSNTPLSRSCCSCRMAQRLARPASCGWRTRARSRSSIYASTRRHHSQRSADGSRSSRCVHPLHALHTCAHDRRSCAEQSFAAPSSACGKKTLVGNEWSGVTCTSGSSSSSADAEVDTSSNLRTASVCRSRSLTCPSMSLIIPAGLLCML